jgi:hypothetical protein
LPTPIPQSAESSTLRVATAAPLMAASAAIWASKSPIGRPDARRAAAISANDRAAARSNARTRPAKSRAKVSSTAYSSAARRFPAAVKRSP